MYLDDPEVSIDTNHLERVLRVIPMGRKNWLFSWTELGAKHVGIVGFVRMGIKTSKFRCKFGFLLNKNLYLFEIIQFLLF